MRADAKHAARLASSYLPASAWSAQDKQTHSWTIRSHGSHRVNRHSHKHTQANIHTSACEYQCGLTQSEQTSGKCGMSCQWLSLSQSKSFTASLLIRDSRMVTSSGIGRNIHGRGWNFSCNFPFVLVLRFFGALQAEGTRTNPLFEREHATRGRSLHVSYNMVELAAE